MRKILLITAFMLVNTAAEAQVIYQPNIPVAPTYPSPMQSTVPAYQRLVQQQTQQQRVCFYNAVAHRIMCY